MHELIWWRRPRLIAALCCAAIGLALLAAGPLLRAALSPSVEPVSALTGVDLLDTPLVPEAAPQLEIALGDELVVYVSGAVARPDVYRLPGGARVKDALVAAGGLRDDAASERLNLAEPLKDAEHIHVPYLADLLAAPAAEPASIAEAAAEAGGLLELNSASVAELEDLPGIGAVLAERIVARREQEGPYRAVDDLREVSGIGEKLFAQISPLVTVGS